MQIFIILNSIRKAAWRAGMKHLLSMMAVLAVKCGENEGDIIFLGYDVAEWTCSGWSSYAECCSNTDNDIYLFVDEWLKDHNKK